jgi:hypothetical protein
LIDKTQHERLGNSSVPKAAGYMDLVVAKVARSGQRFSVFLHPLASRRA